jgi:glyoxylase-like metal-dependent hydrolase (beta-lactamase superfamily II)
MRMSDPVIAAAAEIVQQTDPAAVQVRSFFDEATFTVTHVLSDPAAGKAAIIDSVLDFDPASGRTSTSSADAVIAYIREQDLEVEWLLETHAHADHLSAAPYLQEQLGGKLAIGRHILTVQETFGKIFNEGTRFARDGSQFDHLFDEGDRFSVGSISAIALHVPGHTPADMAYVIGDAVFIGDTLFMPDYGSARADFPGGDAHTLYRSVRRLLSLPESTRLFLCHDYKAPGRDTYAWETTVADQRSGNVHLHDGISEEDFVAMRKARDATLDMPRLILPSIQVNMRGGHFPEPEDNGVSYLKLPLNRL